MPRSKKLEDGTNTADRKAKGSVPPWESIEKIFVGLDVHKKTIQTSVMDRDA